MPEPNLLLQRLNEIATSLAGSGHGLALLALGSVGLELDRLDQYSDLDFFAIVESGWAQAFINNIDWLRRVHPILFTFQNTQDGYKLLYEDGVFCEMAVFELEQLPTIPFAPGRVVWKRQDIPEELLQPHSTQGQRHRQDENWLLGEALTNLYVGLERHARGEQLSATRFIQGYAVDRLLELTEIKASPRPGYADPYNLERRFEARYPAAAAYLPEFIQGYHRTPQSALAILAYLEVHFQVDPAFAAVIRRLALDLG